jgi:hypothetical protein
MGEMILCVPGCWKDRTEFVRQVVSLDDAAKSPAGDPNGQYMFAGMILADLEAKDHVPLDFCPADAKLPRAFEIAGQGKLPEELLVELKQHSAVVYVRFPLDLPRERERVLKFSSVLRRAGGLAVKVESAGVAHTWERWSLLLSGTPFDLYSAVVVLVGDEKYFYSSGMHHFGLPESAVPRSIPAADAADLVNRFNYWRIVERPVLSDGHTFSPTPSAPHFRMTLEPDSRHEVDDPFHNAHGVWCLRGVPSSAV